MSLEARRLPANHPHFPRALQGETLWTIGNPVILAQRLLALYCSVRCPGEAIIRTYDLARALRDAGIAVIGGFHSPMEQECLDFLLRGKQPVVICPARGIQSMRIPGPWRQPLQEGRLLILSSFPIHQKRPTAKTAAQRNQQVAQIADAIFIAHAETGGSTHQLCSALAAEGKPLYTHDLQTSQPLIKLGARGVDLETLLTEITLSL